MSPSVELRMLELELFEFYGSFRGVSAPRNLWSEGHWRRVEELLKATGGFGV